MTIYIIPLMWRNVYSHFPFLQDNLYRQDETQNEQARPSDFIIQITRKREILISVYFNFYFESFSTKVALICLIVKEKYMLVIFKFM